MKTQSEIQTLKQIPIEGYLANKGIYPISKSGVWLMYHSPLRDDNKPSFGVNTTKNTFNDLGSDDKGNVIELVMKLDNIGFVGACNSLESMDFVKEKEISQPSFLLQSQTPFNNTASYQIRAVKVLQNPALISLVESRKISFQTAFKYLNEIHYTDSKGNDYFGVGYEKDNGGYVVRNKFLDKNIHLGQSGIKTFAVPNAKTLTLWEGFWDFLSGCDYIRKEQKSSAIILNSTKNVNKALPIISQYEEVFCYLDNDKGGWEALGKLKDAGINVNDCSDLYAKEKFKDFNQFLISKFTV